ncbi:hypothetical protein MPTK1_4g09700 [Marchantia polymorpha subsp. ruderalis]|uniref:Uncharacterized protein n=2 Tax=Marchantia polymorpha TaxID=3197 RepID=A0AAF6B870_MARPO|nr:hypothetical protein MARPO_0132s0013 [Marchantia polymorpha]BBN08204.1 hypothetical protein Mp_4g09700 [Marchantia polymorpha subsp. ruderalis]|eukprot:PTQ29934.1 hypothetical protein MARPO_0132s0013 [Marchantia polymorpha]
MEAKWQRPQAMEPRPNIPAPGSTPSQPLWQTKEVALGLPRRRAPPCERATKVKSEGYRQTAGEERHRGGLLATGCTLRQTDMGASSHCLPEGQHVSAPKHGSADGKMRGRARRADMFLYELMSCGGPPSRGQHQQFGLHVLGRAVLPRRCHNRISGRAL